MYIIKSNLEREGGLTGFEPATSGVTDHIERKMVPPEVVDFWGLRFSYQLVGGNSVVLSVLLDTSQQSSKQPQKQPHLTAGLKSRRYI